MKIVRAWAPFNTDEEFTVSDAIKSSLAEVGSESGGMVEDLSEQVRTLQKVVTILVDALYSNRTLSQDQIGAMLSYQFDVRD